MMMRLPHCVEVVRELSRTGGHTVPEEGMSEQRQSAAQRSAQQEAPA